MVFPGFRAEHTTPTGPERRFHLQPLTPLAAHFTVYWVSPKPGLQPGSTIADLARHYAYALDGEFRGPVCILGVSTGGSIAQQFAIDHPQLVRRLVLTATACRLAPAGRQMQRNLARFTMAGQPRRAWAATGPGLATTSGGGHLLAALLWLLGAHLSPKDPSDMLVTIDAEDRFDAAPQLQRISAPTLLVAGDRDRYYTPELFRETAERIPAARLRLYAGKGHASIATLRHKPAIGEILQFLTAGDQQPPHDSARGWAGRCRRSPADTGIPAEAPTRCTA